MPTESRTVAPGPDARSVRTAGGSILRVPDAWTLVPPGDPALTRRIKAAGPCWSVIELRGRKTFSRGIWTNAATVERIQADLAKERSDPAYARKQTAAAAKRHREQIAYVDEFRNAVRDFLRFAPRHADLAERLAEAVATHATPVGSGTVARTERSPVEQRASAAVIAWMRHQTTAYDRMSIARIKGERRAVRRMLAERSNALLNAYRHGHDAPVDCPLARALREAPAAEVSPRTEPAAAR